MSREGADAPVVWDSGHDCVEALDAPAFCQYIVLGACIQKGPCPVGCCTAVWTVTRGACVCEKVGLAPQVHELAAAIQPRSGSFAALISVECLQAYGALWKSLPRLSLALLLCVCCACYFYFPTYALLVATTIGGWWYAHYYD